MSTTAATASALGLDALWKPGSVAIVGASSDSRRFGGRPIQYLREGGFEGPIYPVNPVRDHIQGLKAYASLEDVPGPVDCAILAVDADATLAAIRSCAKVGVKTAVLFAAGYSEAGEDGSARQRELVALARESRIRLLGPNCMGIFNAGHKFYATFASGLEEGFPASGGVGLVSQSGGYGGYVLKHMLLRRMGLSCWATTGNEADLEFGELFGWMATHDDVEVLVGYMEGVRSRDSLVNALELARRNHKPVVLMKVGRTEEGRVAAASHTASLTGEDAAYDALFKQFGVHRARTTAELLDVAYAATKARYPKGKRVGVVSVSGGVGVQISDYVSDAGLVMAPTPEPTQAALREIVPYCSPRNPIDMTGLSTIDASVMHRTVDLALTSGAFDALLVFIGIGGSAPSYAGPLREAMVSAAEKHPDKLVLVSITAPEDIVRRLDEAGFIVLEDPWSAVTALQALDRFREAFEGRTPAIASAPTAAPAATIPEGRVNETQAKRVLEENGVRLPRESLVKDPEAAAAAAVELGFPVALKVVSPDIVHKTECGGVALNLTSVEAVQTAARTMAEVVPQKAPGARIDGYLVSEMVTGGVECVIGINADPSLGPVVTFGLGGVLVELLRDTTCRLAPVDLAEAEVMVRELKTFPLLAGYRGGPACDTAALAQAIVALSKLAAANQERIQSIEVNPLVVLPGQRGVVALDAVLLPKKPRD